MDNIKSDKNFKEITFEAFGNGFVRKFSFQGKWFFEDLVHERGTYSVAVTAKNKFLILKCLDECPIPEYEISESFENLANVHKLPGEVIHELIESGFVEELDI